MRIPPFLFIPILITFYPTGWHPPNWIATWRPKAKNVMLDTWGRFDSPNSQLMDWLLPTSWGCYRYLYHTVLEKHFRSRGFLHQWGMCACSLSPKGYDSHKSNPRFSTTWTLLSLPGARPIPDIFSLLLLNPQQSSSIWPLSQTSSTWPTRFSRWLSLIS